MPYQHCRYSAIALAPSRRSTGVSFLAVAPSYQCSCISALALTPSRQNSRISALTSAPWRQRLGVSSSVALCAARMSCLALKFEFTRHKLCFLQFEMILIVYSAKLIESNEQSFVNGCGIRAFGS